MTEIVDLSKRRQPVTYTVTITHHWDDTLEVFVADVADDERSRASVADALHRASQMFGPLAPAQPALTPKPVDDSLAADPAIKEWNAAIKAAAAALDALPEAGSADFNMGISRAYSVVLALKRGGAAHG